MSRWLPPGHGGYRAVPPPDDDPLRPARGCLFALLLSPVAWGIVLFLVVMVLLPLLAFLRWWG